MADLVGQTVGSYQIEARLGAGGMGEVYRARHVHLGRLAAIKIMRRHLADNPTFQARFRQEAKASAALNHLNIIQIYDFGEDDDSFFLVMELVNGGSLRTLMDERISSGQGWPLALGINLVRQAAEGLAYAHEQGMIHRDIKPDNLLLHNAPPRTGEAPVQIVKVCDFGLARLAEGGMHTSSGVMLGTPAYMSPEQCQGIDLDARSDLYSLGIVLYEVAAGKPPFEMRTLSDAIYKHVYVSPSSPRLVRPEIPIDLEMVIMRCLAKRPEDRFASMSELSQALRGIVDAGTVNTTSIVPTPDPIRIPASAVPTERAADGEGQPRPPLFALPRNDGTDPRVHVVNQDGSLVGSYTLTGNGLTVGRLPANVIRLDSEGISRHHLVIDWNGRTATVTDLGSSNGSVLRGARMTPNEPVDWTDDEPVRIGPYWLHLVPPADASIRAAVAPAAEVLAMESTSPGAARAAAAPAAAGAASGGRSRLPLLIGAALLAILVLGGGAALAMGALGGGDDPEPTATAALAQATNTVSVPGAVPSATSPSATLAPGVGKDAETATATEAESSDDEDDEDETDPTSTPGPIKLAQPAGIDPAAILDMERAINQIAVYARLGDPVGEPEAIAATYQEFDGGMVVWIDQTIPGAMLVMWYEPERQEGQFVIYEDVFTVGDTPPTPDAGLMANPPDERYTPVFPISVFWQSDAEIRERLGWSTWSEGESVLISQQCKYGTLLWLYPSYRTWMLYGTDPDARTGPYQYVWNE